MCMRSSGGLFIIAITVAIVTIIIHMFISNSQQLDLHIPHANLDA